MSSLRKPVHDGATPDEHDATVPCTSCGAPVAGNFCAACGESRVAHVPGVGEFVHEFVGHFVALEGKLWDTLRLLVRHPGQLTVAFLAGRRMPYIPPLRLYLSLSLVFFAMIKLFGVELPHLNLANSSLGVSYVHTMDDTARPGKKITANFSATVYDAPEDERERDEIVVREQISRAMALVGQVNSRWQANLASFMREPDAVKNTLLNKGFLAYLPYMLIGALPLFALYLKLIYWRTGRRYGEHLVFALHANAFAFLLACLMIVLPGSAGWLLAAIYMGHFTMIAAWDWVQLLPFLCLVGYLPLAMQRVYGGKPGATALRWLVLITAHLLVVAVSTIAAQLIGILGRGA